MTVPATPQLDDKTLLALDRTRLAYERTMMAWVRTAVSLITFGFSIYKFFQFEAERRGVPQPGQLIGPRSYALMMIVIGLVALLLAAVQHRANLRSLNAEFTAPQPLSVAGWVAGLVALLGLLALVAVLVHG